MRHPDMTDAFDPTAIRVHNQCTRTTKLLHDMDQKQHQANA